MFRADCRDYWLFKSPMFAFTGQFVMAPAPQDICRHKSNTELMRKNLQIYFCYKFLSLSLSVGDSVNGLVTLNVSFTEY